MRYRIVVTVKDVKGCCPIYKVGDRMVFEDFYLRSRDSENVCIHALSAMLSLLSPFLRGCSAVELGIGSEEDVGYLQCPDPGPPYTRGGVVTFELRQEAIKDG